MSDRPTAPNAEASAETPAPQDVASSEVSVTPEPELSSAESSGPEATAVNGVSDSAATPRSGGKGKLIAGGLAVVVIAGLGAYASLPWWVDSLPPSVRPMAQRLLPAPAASATAALETQMTLLRNKLTTVQGEVRALQSRVGVLEQTPKAMPAPASDPSTPANTTAEPAPMAMAGKLDQRLSALETMLNGRHGTMVEMVQTLRQDLDELKASRATASALLTLSDRVNGLESAVEKAVSRQDRALAFLLAVGQLRAAIEGGRGFDDELKTVQAMAPADLDVAAQVTGFAGHALSGVPTLTHLQQSFAPLGAQVIRASALPDETADWWNRTVDRLLTVITIRRIDGDAVGSGPAAVVSRAEALLNAGSLAEAVAEMSALTGAPAEAASAWMSQAQARLAADKALNALTGTALAALTASQTAEPGKEG
jgi:uroporphyrinogen-III synthase